MIDVIVIWLVSAQLINLKETYHARVITMDNNGIGKRHHSVFDGVSKQMVLLDTYKIISFVKWVFLHYTIAVFRRH